MNGLELTVDKTYLALLYGRLLPDRGAIEAPIGRDPQHRQRMAVLPGARHARTEYLVREHLRGATHVEAALKTGRMHQIRVHFAWKRHPLVGDPVYGGRLALPKGASDAVIETLRGFRRQALHAARLEFSHPVTGETVTCEAPIPDDMARLMTVLREAAREDDA